MCGFETCIIQRLYSLRQSLTLDTIFVNVRLWCNEYKVRIHSQTIVIHFGFTFHLPQIYQFSIQKCGRHTSCEACVTTPNPLCGWCSAEGRCGTIMDCPTSGQPNHYVAHGNNATCPVITMVTPSTIDVQNISNVKLYLSKL